MTTTKPLPVAPAASPRRRTTFVFAASSIAALLVAASALTPFYPGLEHELDITALGVSLIFAVYAIMLLAALVTAGAISDHVGRRPVISIGFSLLAVSMLMVAFVDSAPMLFAARALQGAASGLLTPALSALLLDATAADRPQRGSLLNSIMPGTGLAIGALAGGIACAFLVPGLPITFAALAVLYAVIAVMVWRVPEFTSRTPGALRSLIPRVTVPLKARRLFLISAPALMATWATGGLFFSLGPSIILERLHSDSPLLQGAIVAILPAAGAAAVLLLRRRSARSVALTGTVSLAIGTTMALVALAADTVAGYVLSVIITGIGFGASFSGVIGSLAPKAEPHTRAGLFAAIYVTSYLSFGVPTVAAGFLASISSVSFTSLAYGIAVIALALISTTARVRSRE
ncbi:MFS transporter [Paramicrobacterium agarici]|uniref:MFS transporter n=1 Tax=Paramicrobacterium agarici TaxID=630514 RepID=A0A2A9DX73_9MICO|nr:MFS transporter [Microbacterium agarici]PFG30509.1 MFS transporter [Microbacterium agarici]